MTEDHQDLNEPVRIPPDIVVDGDVNDEAVRRLIALQLEEERLDYKGSVGIATKADRTRSKIDLVCDLVAMANTDGGYVVIGVSECSDGSYETTGTEDQCIAFVTQENVQSWVQSYTDVPVRIRARVCNITESRKVIAVCVFPSALPVIFTKHGQYLDPRTGESVHKFADGELFVRHGSKSERATSADWAGMNEQIRHDEREHASFGHSQHAEVLERLDSIVRLLGGVPPAQRRIGLLENPEDVIEERMTSLISLRNPVAVRRALRREFRQAEEEMKQLSSTTPLEETKAQLGRGLCLFLQRLLPVWVAALEYGDEDSQEHIRDWMHRTYCRCHDLELPTGLRPFELQARVLSAAYVLGSYAVMRAKPAAARLLVDLRNPFDRYWNERSWARYVQVMLSRAGMLERKTFITLVFEEYQHSEYVLDVFEAEECFRTSLCKFDFLECATTVQRTGDASQAYPGFAAYRRQGVELLIEDIAFTCEEGKWLPEMTPAECAQLIAEIDALAAKVCGFKYDWWPGEWSSPTIEAFLREHLNGGNSMQT